MPRKKILGSGLCHCSSDGLWGSLSKLETKGRLLLALFFIHSHRKGKSSPSLLIQLPAMLTVRGKVPFSLEIILCLQSGHLKTFTKSYSSVWTICAYPNLKKFQLFLTSSDSQSGDPEVIFCFFFSLSFISKLISRFYQFFPPNIPHTCYYLSISTVATLA